MTVIKYNLGYVMKINELTDKKKEELVGNHITQNLIIFIYHTHHIPN